MRQLDMDLMETGKIQPDPRGDFVIEKHESEYYRVSKIENGEKSIQYIFTTDQRELTEFAGMCRYHQTSPNSHFTQKRLITRPTENGRITISGDTLKITEAGRVIRESRFAEEEFAKYLLDWFNIDEAEL